VTDSENFLEVIVKVKSNDQHIHTHKKTMSSPLSFMSDVSIVNVLTIAGCLYVVSKVVASYKIRRELDDEPLFAQRPFMTDMALEETTKVRVPDKYGRAQ
jgi:hypothetical protein